MGVFNAGERIDKESPGEDKSRVISVAMGSTLGSELFGDPGRTLDGIVGGCQVPSVE